jgi:hypothetical protein
MRMWALGCPRLRKEPSEQGECGCLKVAVPAQGGHLAGAGTKSLSSFEVTTDGAGVVGHAGAALLDELADRVGLTRALGGTRSAAGAVMPTRWCCGIWQ